MLMVIVLGWCNKTCFLLTQAWRGCVPVQTKARCISLCCMMTKVLRRDMKMAWAMIVTSACRCLYIISVTSKRVGVLNRYLQLVVVKRMIWLTIPLTLWVQLEALFHPLALPVQGNCKWMLFIGSLLYVVCQNG